LSACLFTAASLQSQYDSGIASLDSATQNLNATSSSIQSTVDRAKSDYQKCIKANGVFSSVFCLTQLQTYLSTQFQSIASVMTQNIQATYNAISKVLGSLAGTSLTSASQAATAGVQAMTAQTQQQIDQFNSQTTAIINQASDCFNQVPNNAAATTTTVAPSA